MKLLWRVGAKIMLVERNDGVTYQLEVSNAVRNAENGKRSLENPEDVVLTTPDDKSAPRPYMPSGFPPGKWEVTAVLARTSDYLAPYFIATNAWKMTPEWSLSPAGDYEYPTGKMVRDAGFGIHYAKGTSTTLGCLRALNRDSLKTLAELIMVELKAGRKVPVEVLE